MKRVKGIFETKSIRWKLLFRFFIIFIILIFAMEAFQYVIMRQNLLNSKQQLLESRTHNIEPHLLQEIKADSLKENTSRIIKAMLDVDVGVAIIDSSGNVIVNAPNKRDSAPVKPIVPKSDYIKALKQKSSIIGYKIYKDEKGHDDLVIWRKVGNLESSSGLIQLSTSIESVEDILNQQLYIYIVVSIVILMMGILVGGKALESTLKPLYNMTNTVEQISVGQLDMRLPIDNKQLEIDRLSTAFNEMLERIETSFKKEQYIMGKMRQFISDASHELRTPLTSIHGFAEVLLSGAAKNEKQLNSALNSILIESERLGKLVNDLLMLTRLDQHITVEMKKEDIKSIVEEAYPQLKIIGGERKILLDLKDNIFVNANRNQIKQVILNLAHNAIQHTDETEGIINISLEAEKKADGSFAVLKVKDNGSGIPEKDLSEVFDRFFRSEAHRSRKHGGYGLGLSIVRSIVEAHKGEIRVNSEVGKGTCFTIYLKLL